MGSRLYDEAPNAFCKSTFLTIQPLGDFFLTIDQNSTTEKAGYDLVELMLAEQIFRRCFKSFLDHHSEKPHLSWSEHLFLSSVMKDKNQR